MTPNAAIRDATPSLQSMMGSWLRRHQAASITEREALVVLFDCSQWTRFHGEANQLLPGQERERSHRFRQEQHRTTYVMAHAVWRLVLAEVLGVAPEALALENTAHGQPCLPGSGYATSLSHSGNQVAIAVARATCIGIDIEQSPPRAGMRDLIRVVCTPDEADALHAVAASMQDAALLALWTRKEALLKAFGVGLLTAPSSIPADAGVPHAPPAMAAGMPACIVHPLALPEGWMGALAAPEHVTSLRVLALPLHATTFDRHASGDRPVM